MKNIIQISGYALLLSAMFFLPPTAAKGQAIILSEDFETGTAPAGWTQSFTTGNTSWDFGVTGGFSGIPANAYSGMFNSRFHSSSGDGTLLITPAMNLENCTSASLLFYHTQAFSGSDLDSLAVLYRTGPADPWVRLAGYQSSITSWAQEFIELPDVSGNYQIAFHGFSQNGNGVCIDAVTVMATIHIPFTETWDNGTFSYNNWTVSGANWSIDSGSGNPAPAAGFSGQPAVQNYEQWIEIPALWASGWTCADIWLDFDLKLVSNNNTGNEKFFVETYKNGVWTTREHFKNIGSFDWTSQHIGINPGVNSFSVRFRVSGVNSNDIIHWYIDNVHIYGTCRPPLDIDWWAGVLSWDPPDCDAGFLMNFIFDDGTWENGWRYNPGYLGWYGTYFDIDPAFSGQIVNMQVYFVDNGSGSAMNLGMDIFNSSQTLLSSVIFNAYLFDTWIDVPMPYVPFNGQFYGMVKWDSVTGNSYYLADDEDGPNAGLGYQYDGTTWTESSPACVFFVRASAIVNNELKDIYVSNGRTHVVPAAPKPHASSIDMSGDSGNHDKMSVTRFPTDSSTLIGYNVWSTDSTGTGPFYLQTPVPITETHYSYLPPDFWEEYLYFVESVFEDQANPGTVLCTAHSDTTRIHWVGIDDLDAGSISIFPNPAVDYLDVTSSSSKISSVEVLNLMGQIVCSNDKVNAAATRIDVQGLSAGVYFVKVTTLAGTLTKKFMKI